MHGDTTNMDATRYVIDSSRTAEIDRELVAKRVDIDLMHAGFGLATETGEFVDCLKKNFFYGQKLDRVNLIEELGDVMWYMALAARSLDVSLEQIMETNINKLKLRYKDKFTETEANERDLESERKLLEEQKRNIAYDR